MAGLGAAILLSGLLAYFASDVLEVHSTLVGELCLLAGLPVTGWTAVNLFPSLPLGTTPLVRIPPFESVSVAARFALIASIAGLMLVAARLSFLRNLSYFLAVLLFLSATANAVFDTFRMDPAIFGQIWLRQELLVWFILPWVLLLLFVVPEPKWARGLAWMAFVLGYGLVFSAMRFVFVLGVLHYSGALFMPALWFLFGTLSDLLYVLFFFSIAVHRSSGELWGERSAWRSHF
ncbi:MAG: hypothetical protein FJW30_11385 [Acidobacteria bacterium]|nr:hypothetical protein [Acidobacteriota bacterium]